MESSFLSGKKSKALVSAQSEIRDLEAQAFLLEEEKKQQAKELRETKERHEEEKKLLEQ